MQISFAELHGYPVVRVQGHLSRATSPLLRDALEKVAVEHPPGILCDLDGLAATDEGLPVFHVVLDSLSSWWPGPLVLLSRDPALRDHLDRLRIARRAPVVADVDDALAALRSPPEYHRASLAVPVGPDAVAVAERFVADLLSAWEALPCLDPARLVTAELVGNAVVHGGGQVRLHLSAEGADVMVSVGDRGTARRLPAPTDSGVGLFLVSQVSHRWGALPRTGGGHLVWARLRCRRAETAFPCLP